MKLTNIRLGDYIESYKQQCRIPNLTVDDVSGINIDKEFFEPSKQVGADTSKYLIVPNGYFACNLMHIGRDVVIPIAYNHSGQNKIVSPAYQVFKFKDADTILPLYFVMLLKSTEKDRFCWLHTDASIRGGMTWDDFCELTFDVPPVEIQQKYVDIYNALLENLEAYEKGTEDLKLVCDGYIEQLREDVKSERIGNYLEEFSERNKDGKVTLNQGVSINKTFVTPTLTAKDRYSTKIVYNGNIVYKPATTKNDNKISIALRQGETCIVSNSYKTLKVIKHDNKEVLPEYLMLWFSRSEFDRYARFHSWGTAHEFFTIEDMNNVEFPIPDIETQRAIVDIYNVYIERQEIAKRVRKEIKNICPILIAGSIRKEQ